jgi:hypothetical protein
LKFIHKVRNRKRKAKIDFELYHLFRFGVMLLFALAGSVMLLMPSGWGINILKRTKVRGLE